MRTIEEVLGWLKSRELSDYTEDGGFRIHGDGELFRRQIVAFIESPPPCKHENRSFMTTLNVAAFLVRMAVNPRCLVKPQYTDAKFCPDCGERLVKE